MKNKLFAKTLIVFFASSFVMASSFCVAQSTPRLSLIALSKSDHTLAIVDPVSLKVIARVPVGRDPHEVIASTDGKTAYVSIYGGGSLHELNVIDLVAQKPLFNIDTRPLFRTTADSCLQMAKFGSLLRALKPSAAMIP